MYSIYSKPTSPEAKTEAKSTIYDLGFEGYFIEARSGVIVSSQIIEEIKAALEKMETANESFRTLYNMKKSPTHEPYPSYNEDVRKANERRKAAHENFSKVKGSDISLRQKVVAHAYAYI